MVANGEIPIENAAIPKMNLTEISGLAEQFVLQYYTVMNQCPESLHRFYSDESVLVYESQPVSGQANIHSLLTELNLKDTRVIILKIDALKSHMNSVLVQVAGELSVSGGPYRRFMRSFTLVEKDPSNFFVLADILRYQDRVYIAEKKQPCNVAAEEHETKHTASKQTSKSSPNGGPTERKSSARHKPVEHKVEEQFSKKSDTENPRPTSPKAPTESNSRKQADKSASESNVNLQSVPRQQEQVQPTSAAQNKQLHQQPVVQQQQPTVSQAAEQPSSSAPMSWAQRASGNAAASVSYGQPRVQAAKPAVAEHSASAIQSAQPPKMNSQKPMRVGFNNNGGSTRHQQQQGPSNREPGSDWTENTHGQTQHGRGGFVGPRGNIRGGNVGSPGNRGSRGGAGGAPRGGNRGAGNPSGGGTPNQRR